MTSHPQRHSFQVTGDGHQGISLSGVGRSAFSRRKPGVSSRWPNGRRLNSRCPCPSPVTESFCLCFAACPHVTLPTCPLAAPPRPLLHRSSAPICTFALPLLPSCPQVLVSSHAPPLSPCQLASMPPRASACPRVPSRAPSPARYFFPFFAAGDGNIPPLGNVTILNSPPDAVTQRLYSSWGSLEVE